MTAPAVARTRAELVDLLKGVRVRGGRVALVPTMGALHEGHASLVREARRRVGGPDAVVVSIFVNPLQFGPGEDLERYPRTFEADLALCAREGVDVVFHPDLDEVYPGGEPRVSVDPGPDERTLEGRVRPGHFRGVATVVAKLFGLVRPDLAVFGEKDYEQLCLVRRMSADLCLGVEVVGAETVREDDGLALSSRNRYLTREQRVSARSLNEALQAGVAAGKHGAQAVLDAAAGVLADHPEVEVDYLALTDPAMADPALADPPRGGAARLLVAARVGTTRLIDNTALTLGGPTTAGSP